MHYLPIYEVNTLGKPIIAFGLSQVNAMIKND